jgi:soluble lytic murein transglycosylase-like protein
VYNFTKKVEFVAPFFFAALVAMNVCAFIVLQEFFPPEPAAAAAEPEADLERELFSSLEGLSSAFLLEREAAPDMVFDYYREDAFREWVILFFAAVCGSRDVADAILTNAETFNVPPSLAFALCWEESRYQSRAINRRNLNGSIDRGLFQLNNRSFPALTEADFFNPWENARQGMGHLRWCLDSAGSEIAALAIYNAGATRVGSTGAPKHTLDYIDRILENRRKIDGLFRTGIASVSKLVDELGLTEADQGEGTAIVQAPEPVDRPRFTLLGPLSGR